MHQFDDDLIIPDANHKIRPGVVQEKIIGMEVADLVLTGDFRGEISKYRGETTSPEG